jgi:hypothetical protein
MISGPNGTICPEGTGARPRANPQGHAFSGSCAQPKSRPGPLACEATHRIKEAGYRRKQERAFGRGFNPLISPENLCPDNGGGGKLEPNAVITNFEDAKGSPSRRRA